MKQFKLSGSHRENVGRQDASALRNAGRIPGVLYGGTEQVHFSVAEIDMNKIMSTSDTLQIDLNLGEKTYASILQEVQRHPVTDRIVHVDFLELVPGKAIKTSLPVRVTGNSEGVKSGGRLAINYRKVRVFAKPEDLPTDITLDITKLNIGDMIRVREVQMPGVQVLEAEASAILAIQATRASMAAEQAEKDAGKAGKKK
jgi:large subunit ribosomal protein L25